MTAPSISLPPSATRVEINTDEQINARIEAHSTANVIQAFAGGQAAIDKRLKELEREWDIERALQANAATLLLLTLGLGFCEDRRWFAVPLIISGFLMQHAVEGWCPPVPVLRRLGFRTPREIAIEVTALRLLRGDFSHPPHGPHEAFTMARGKVEAEEQKLFWTPGDPQ